MTGLDFPLLEHSVLELTSGLWLELISVLFTLVSWLFSRKRPDPGRPGEESFFVPRATHLPLAKHQPPRSCHSAQNLQWFSISLGIKNSKSSLILSAGLDGNSICYSQFTCKWYYCSTHSSVTKQLPLCGKRDFGYSLLPTVTILRPT